MASLFRCVPLVAPSICASRVPLQLRDVVFGSNVAPSSLLTHVGGGASVKDLLRSGNVRLPADQLDFRTAHTLLPKGDALLYAAAAALHARHHATLDAFWHFSPHPLASL